MKKLVIFFLSVVMMMSVAGCNQEVNHLVTEDTSSTTDVVKDSEESSQDVTEVVDTKETSEDDRSREEVTTEAKIILRRFSKQTILCFVSLGHGRRECIRT